MPTFRVVWEFIEANGSGFNEVYYVDGANAASAVGISDLLRIARLNLLHTSNKWQRIRASQVDQQRVTAQNNLSQFGLSVDTAGPVPTGAAAVCALVGQAGGQRKLWLRGVGASSFMRNASSGADQPPAFFLQKLTQFFAGLQNDLLGIRRLMPTAPPGGGVLSKIKIVTVAPNARPGLADITLAAAPGYPFPSRVLIGGASKKDLPSLNGHWQLVAAPVGALVTIPYQTPGNMTINGGNAYMRQESYFATSVFNAAGCGFDHYGTHTSRVPLFRSRGARRAARLRSAL
jgi:hypothetical protein